LDNSADTIERLRALSNIQPEPCPWGKLVAETAETDPELAEVLEESIRDKNIAVRRLHAELKNAGIISSPWTMGNHRKGRCSCPPKGI